MKKDKWLIFALYDLGCNLLETSYAIYEGDFPTKKQAEKFMKEKIYGTFRGITGIQKIPDKNGWK